MNRRDVLRAAAALPFLPGLGCSRAPSWFGEALIKMRREGKPGLVLRLPRDPKGRCRIGHALAWILEREDVDGLEVAHQAVILCLEDPGVRSLLSGARDGEDLLLIDADGTVLDGRRLDEESDLTELAGELLDGPKLSRLKARAGTNELSRLVLESREDQDLEEKIVALGKGTPPPLPYGASLEPGAARKCGEDPACRYGQACGACGLAVITPRSREFVKFLAK
ncbi:MAG TPA: hypothetical protein VF950_11655 [Planctomycetota bacterium]